MTRAALANIASDRELMDEIFDRANSSEGIPQAKSVGLKKAAMKSVLETLRDEHALEGVAEADLLTAEAIVLLQGRPSFLVQEGTFTIANSDVWANRLTPRQPLESAIRSAGRIELRGHASLPWVGTGWLVRDDIVVTNRHVAMEFARRQGRDFVFLPGVDGVPMRSRIDFREEYQQANSVEIAVERVLYVAEPGARNPDVAFLKVASSSNLAPPIPLALTSQPTGRYIAVIGYPAWDGRRNDPDVMQQVFGNIFNVKRLAPGMLIPLEHPTELRHDCSTLGGNSGSVVIDVLTGAALGLHFGGRYQVGNYAVRAEVVRRLLSGLPRQRTISVGEEERPRPADYANREGYLPDFLSDAQEHFVPLPALSTQQAADAVRRTDAGHVGETVLKYEHFSIVMSKTRRLPYLTACNIDGSSLRRFRRQRDVWVFDPRIPEQYQTGNELYQGNRLDRGHQVRRLDPVWGEVAEAKKAEKDTFHYTNSCPQHERLNQNQNTWAGLEDYVLDNTEENSMRVSVFTGPVLQVSDPVYRGVKIPQEYWKVVVMVRDDGRLSATAYLLSQASLMEDLEFVFGAYRTFQVAISFLEERTKLKFGDLMHHDPLEGREAAMATIELRRLEDMVI